MEPTLFRTRHYKHFSRVEMSSLSVLVSGGGRRDSGYSPAKDEAGGLSPLLKVKPLTDNLMPLFK